jgi:hypothetical protein
MTGGILPTRPERPVRPAEGPAPPPEPAALVACLEQVRARVHRGLDRIEALTRQRPAADTGADLDRRRSELDQARAQFEAEARNWEKARKNQLEELERDRRLLAEAWERLEREQVEGPAPPAPPVAASGSSILRAVGPAAPVARTTSAEESPITQAVLRQFESLRRDVRRSAESRRPG